MIRTLFIIVAITLLIVGCGKKDEGKEKIRVENAHLQDKVTSLQYSNSKLLKNYAIKEVTEIGTISIIMIISIAILILNNLIWLIVYRRKG